MADRDFLNRDRLVGSVRDYGTRGWRAGWSTLGDFQKFLLRGNVVDLAVGVVIGAAFNGVVQEFVKDFLQPLIGLITGNKTFDDQTFTLFGTQAELFYGRFIGVLITFILTAAVIYFFVVKPINALQDRYNRFSHRNDEPAKPTTRDCPFCLSTVPLKATRCAYCTAQLPPADEASAEVASSR